MACACQRGRKTENQPYVVRLPGGRTKSYSSEVAAKAEVKRTAGAYIVPPASESV